MKNSDQNSEPVGGFMLSRQPGTATVPVAYTELPAPYYAAQVEDANSDGILEYWRIIRRNKKTLILFALGGVLLGVLIGVPQKPVYKIASSLEVLNLNDDFMNMKQANPVSNSDYSYDTSEEETQVALLQSDALLSQVLQKIDPAYAELIHKPVAPLSGWRKWLNIPESLPLTPRQKLLEKLVDTMKVQATPRTRLIEVSVKSKDPQLAAEFTNALANEFIEHNIESRWKTTQKVGDWLTRELNGERANLEHSEDALQRYARNSGLIFTDETTNVATEKLQQLQLRLTSLTSDRISKQSRFELAQHSPPDALPDVLDDENLRLSAAIVTDVRRQLADYSAVFTPDYSKVRRLEAQLVATNMDFQRDRDSIVLRVKNDYQEALRREKLLAGEYDDQTREVTGQDEKAIQYNILKREVDSHRQLYDTMLQQMKQSSIATALHASNLRVVDPAVIPNKPIWPDFKVLSAMGLVFGLFSGIGAVVVSERADRSIQQPGEAQFWTKVPELGAIPSASIEAKTKSPKRGDARSLALTNKTLLDGNSIELITWNRKPSLMAEAFRSTLTSILFVGENGSRPKVLVLTSPNPSEGKTTVVSNLGIAMSETRQKVLIIDADLRRSRMHDLFDVPNDSGLSDLLREESSTPETIQAAIRKTEIPGLDILPSGPWTHATANLLYSPNLNQLLSVFRAQYDMVLIDTPPMLQMNDARIIGRLADGVVIVARGKQTTRDALVASSQRFAEDRIRVLGTVLNDWNPKYSARGYYGYYKGSSYTSYKATEPTEVNKS